MELRNKKMSDYINREMAADAIVLECDDVTLEQARQAIKDVPSADVVKVVRCKDCKYGKWKISELDNKTKGYECAIHAVFENDFGDNGYCSYGERKDNE